MNEENKNEELVNPTDSSPNITSVEVVTESAGTPEPVTEENQNKTEVINEDDINPAAAEENETYSNTKEEVKESVPQIKEKINGKPKNKNNLFVIVIIPLLLIAFIAALIFMIISNNKEENIDKIVNETSNTQSTQTTENIVKEETLKEISSISSDEYFKKYSIEEIDNNLTYVLETKDKINFTLDDEKNLYLYVNGNKISIIPNFPVNEVNIYTYSSEPKGPIVVEFIDGNTYILSDDEILTISSNLTVDIDKYGITQEENNVNNGYYYDSDGNAVDICSDEADPDYVVVITTEYLYLEGKLGYHSRGSEITVEEYLKLYDMEDFCENRDDEISLYFDNDGEDEYYFFTEIGDDEDDLSETAEFISKYKCKDISTCSGTIYEVPGTIYEEAKLYVLIYDDSTLYYSPLSCKDYYSSNCKKLNLKALKATSTYTDKDSEIKINTYSINNEKYYMAFLNDEYIYDNNNEKNEIKEYDNEWNLSPRLEDYRISFEKSYAVIGSSSNVKIIDITKKEELFNKDIDLDYDDFSLDISVSDKFNYIKFYYSDEDDKNDVIILTNNYKEICTTKEYLNDTKNNKLYYGDNNKYYSIDLNGEKIKESEKFKKIINITDNYATIVTTDNKFEIINIDTGKVVANFGAWKSSYEVDYDESGYFTYDYDEEDEESEDDYIVIYIFDEKGTSLEDDRYNDYRDGGASYEFYYNLDNGKFGVELPGTFYCGYEKPVLYLYPTSDNTKVTVKFAKPTLLTTTYPKYIDSWNITVNKDGNMTDANGRHYYALYWEESGSIDVDFSEGFYVTKDNAANFLEEKLNILGFTEREANEFIMYWLPKLEANGKSLVYFELTESREKYNKLNITPTPDSLLRVAIHIKKVDKYTKIKEQKLPTFKRKGFTAVEWGGVTHN